MGELDASISNTLLETLEQLSYVIASEDILEGIADTIGKALSAERCSFVVMEPSKGSARIVTTYEDRNMQDFVLDLKRYPELLMSLERPKSASVFDVATTPSLREQAGLYNLSLDTSIMVLPLFFENESEGKFFLRVSRTGRTFSSEETTFCQRIAAVCRNLLKRTYDHQRLESRVQQAIKAKHKMILANFHKSRLLQFISHELKNPLCILNGYINLLMDPAIGDMNEEQTDILRESKQICEMVLDILHSTINFSTVTDGQLVYELRRSSIHGVVDQVLKGVRNEAERKGIRIRLNLPPKLPEVNMDPEKISFAFGNLIYNALRYTPSGGRIMINTFSRSLTRNDETRSFVILSVADNGPGVDPDRIINLFRSGGKLSADASGTTGIGLAISRKILKRHRGFITIDRKYCHGARFLIGLPVVEGEVE